MSILKNVLLAPEPILGTVNELVSEAPPAEILIPPVVVTEEPASLDRLYVEHVTGGSPEVMVYGWRHCYYKEVMRILEAQGKKVFDCTLGDDYSCSPDERTTLDGRRIAQIPISDYEISTQCKAALVNIVIENYLRRKKGKPLIPILFCVDIANNPHPKTAEMIVADKAYVTSKELRRAFKLCFKYGNKKVRQIALETFKFVRLDPCKGKNGEYALVPVIAPWENPEWVGAWEKCGRGKKVNKKIIPWRAALAKEILEIEFPQLWTTLKPVVEKVANGVFGLLSKVSSYLPRSVK